MITNCEIFGNTFFYLLFYGTWYGFTTKIDSIFKTKINRKERVVKGYIKQSSTLYSPHDKIISLSTFVYLLLNIYAVVFKNSFLDVNTVCLAIQSVSLKG